MNKNNIIVGVDMSLRHTGFARIMRTKDESGVTINLMSHQVFDLPSRSKKVKGISIFLAEEIVVRKLFNHLLNQTNKDDQVIVELPTFTQSASSAYCMGVCHAVTAMLMPYRSIEVIDPSALKHWSGSKKGDGKARVKEKVIASVGDITRNDNIIDAIGICLMASDKLSVKEYYERKQNQAGEK